MGRKRKTVNVTKLLGELIMAKQEIVERMEAKYNGRVQTNAIYQACGKQPDIEEEYRLGWSMKAAEMAMTELIGIVWKQS